MTDSPEPPPNPVPRSRRRQPRAQEALFDDAPFGDLSEAAREAVRHPADPRIDTHLASLGLAGDAPAPPAARTRTTAAPDLTPQVEELRAAVARLTAAAETAGASTDQARAMVESLRATQSSLEASLSRAEARARLLAGALAVVAVVALAAIFLALR